MNTSLDPELLDDATHALREGNTQFANAHPGESPGRQPVHTVYGGAQLFSSDSVPKLGALALRAMDTYAADTRTLGEALGISHHAA
ncbi:MAG: phosphoenolpyruvate kinase, partial [Gemmatimonadota bacterium]|nr:phosphoenolpyruvate kinase [Gemmatimonadota bacterium]